jgi:hypothetical protein
VDDVDLYLIQGGSEKAKIGTIPAQQSPFEILFHLEKGDGPSECKISLKLLGNNAVQAHRAAAFVSAMAKSGTLDVVDTSTGLTFASGSSEATKPIVDERVVSFLDHLARVRVKTRTVINLTRELTLEDLENIGKAFAATTKGTFEIEAFTMQFTPTKDYEESKTIGFDPGEIVFAKNGVDVISILDTEVSLGPVEVVAEKATFRLLKTEPPSESAPLGRKHVRVEPVEGTTIFANYPDYSGKKFVRAP